MIMFDGPCFHNTLNSLVNKKDSMESALREVQPFRIYVNWMGSKLMQGGLWCTEKPMFNRLWISQYKIFAKMMPLPFPQNLT